MRKLTVFLLVAAVFGGAVMAFSSQSPIIVLAAEEEKYPTTSAAVSDDDDASIYAIGVYEGGSGHSFDVHPVNPIKVSISTANGPPIKLALSSYEPAEWQITGDGAARVEAIYLAGYHPHTVTGLDNIRIINKSGPQARRSSAHVSDLGKDWGQAASNRAAPKWIGCAYTYPEASGGGCEAGADFVANAQALLDGKVRHFIGKYNAQAFEIKD